MRQFFKFVFASCLGLFLAIFCIFVFFAIWGASALSGTKTSASASPNSILTIKLDKPLPERTNNVAQMDYSNLKSGDVLGLQDILNGIKKAQSDANIKGILLEISNEAQYGQASALAIRKALLAFKKSGKFILANSDYYTLRNYYLSSVADKVYLHPVGGIDFRGVAAQIPFMKDMLDRIGVSMQVYYAGQFKSATEPFRFNKMTDQNRVQIKEYLGDFYDQLLTDVAASRNLDKATLINIANEQLASEPEDALRLKLVDKLAYEDELTADIRQRLGLDTKEKIKSVSLYKYATPDANDVDISVKDQIAVVYAEGNIVDGKGEDGDIGGDKYVDILSKIRKNDNIKGIVLRVNSGGGSSLASEKIWRELTLAKKSGKSVVVSMGDYAASGGYYISCLADSIFAEPNTLTGSIGVFGMLPDASKLMENKLGIHFDTVKIGKYATMGSPFYPMTTDEGKIMQKSVDKVYDIFLKRVADGRKMPTDAVHAIAQGRVWTGKRAAEIGLVDKLGGLQEAVAAAASKAGLKKYRLNQYPKTKEPLQRILEEFTNELNDDESLKEFLMQSDLKPFYPYYEQVKTLMAATKTPQAKLPYILSW
ncbi:MAG: signal peptide peptidase SppA [Saprospiraceae bacterium]|nr:signal peptide peptidase SppA [Saprospiraceae bacterium]MBP7699774.1 signal peptide peptidase SppA [Saprospiraceae bacterium]